MANKRATLITLLVTSVGVFLAENFLDFPFSVSWFLRHSGGVPMLDMLPFRGVDETMAIIAALGSEGRRNHLWFLWTADLVLPVLFGSCLYVAIAQAAASAWPGSRRAARLRWIAVAAALSDYIENLASTALLIAYPERLAILARLSGPLTLVKFLLYGAAVAIALFLFAAVVARRAAGRRHRTARR